MDLKPILDPTNFPMIWIDADEKNRFYMHFFPVTKIQIEYFLCSGSIAAFNAQWYDEVLDYNDRVSPGLISANNYWQAFVTGVKPAEIKQFLSWLGRDYDIPTDEQWQAAYRYLKKEAAEKRYVDAVVETPNISQRARSLIKNVSISIEELRFDVRGGRTLADQALMRMGVMEYVYRDQRRNTYGGYGQPNSTFFGTTETPDKGYPQRLVDEHEGAKMPHYGFRLIKKG